jgi:hypothetical protein
MRISLNTVLSAASSAIFIMATSISASDRMGNAQFPAGVTRAVIPIPADQGKEHAPLTVESVKMGKGEILKEVEVYNASKKVIVQFTLGWNIRNAVTSVPWPYSGERSLGTFQAEAIVTSLKPKRTEKLSEKVDANKLLERLNESNAKGVWMVVVGVTEVVFDDGSRWVADPGSFHSHRQ